MHLKEAQCVPNVNLENIQHIRDWFPPAYAKIVFQANIRLNWAPAQKLHVGSAQ